MRTRPIISTRTRMQHAMGEWPAPARRGVHPRRVAPERLLVQLVPRELERFEPVLCNVQHRVGEARVLHLKLRQLLVRVTGAKPRVHLPF